MLKEVVKRRSFLKHSNKLLKGPEELGKMS
jgi:hypothetical protein